ncbi:ABC transporter permease [Nocardia sp. NPDC051756]|uniref:ABC transporter permease n=1 Tax=Nocardia sp. NPDC051756 TaxID=3154751 RepID=UPI00344054E6
MSESEIQRAGTEQGGDPIRRTTAVRTKAKTSAADGDPPPRRKTGGSELRKHLTLIVALLALLIVGALTKGEDFLSAGNMITILTLASVIGVVTVGMTFVIIGGGIDLSVGAIIALASVWCTTTATQSYGVGGMVLSALLVGLCCGLLNGALIAYGRLVPFIVTLAMMVAARGLAEQISGRQSQLVTTDLLALAQNRVLGIPLLVYLFVVVVAVGWIVLERNTFGRRSAAVGGNPEAARLAGIDVRRHTLLLYAVSGLCCGIAAIMLTAQTTTGTSTNGQLYELDAIAAVVIGGTLLSGGFGTITGSILGVLVFTVIEDLFILNNLEQPIQAIGKGAIIVAVLLFQRFGRARAVPTLT